MSWHIGDVAPDFTAATTKGEIRFHKWAGNAWVFLFSHPGDFTPVCTTELGRTAQLAWEFAARDTKPLGLSTDTVATHLSWITDITEIQRIDLHFPVVADPDLRVAQLYDMVHPGQSKTETVRSVFIIDPKKVIRLIMTYPMNVGRNFEEILRVIDALQRADRSNIATPADWQPGERVVIPLSISNGEAAEAFPQGWIEVRPYLRLAEIK